MDLSTLPPDLLATLGVPVLITLALTQIAKGLLKLTDERAMLVAVGAGVAVAAAQRFAPPVVMDTLTSGVAYAAAAAGAHSFLKKRSASPDNSSSGSGGLSGGLAAAGEALAAGSIGSAAGIGSAAVVLSAGFHGLPAVGETLNEFADKFAPVGAAARDLAAAAVTAGERTETDR